MIEDDIEDMIGFVDPSDRTIEKLIAEVRRLRVDADRYRWLREPQKSWGAMFAEPISWNGGAWVRLGSRWIREHLDKAIDADRAAHPKEGV